MFTTCWVACSLHSTTAPGVCEHAFVAYAETLMARSPDPDDQPAMPAQSPEDIDADWGEHPGTDDDERLNRDRPPHWGDD